MAGRRILFIHDSFPAQFGALGLWLAKQGWEVGYATAATGITAARARAAGLRLLRYAPHRRPSGGTHPYAQPMERAAINAQAFLRTALAARRQGYDPDIVVAHSGWGAGMFARDAFPRARFVAYCEWWYRYPGLDVSYLADLAGEPPPASVEAPMHERARNAPIAMDLAAADAALCPTDFQAAQFPPVFRAALRIEHDGIDTELFSPEAAERSSTLGGLVARDARVVSYATRGMEPHRGFPQFIAALPRVLAADPAAVAVIAGENRVAYGGDAARRVDWKARAMAGHGVDPARVRFVGRLGRADYIRLLRRSDAHVYLTVPFVLSWSMLEAMSAGCALVASDTAPVREFADDSTARLIDMRDGAALADAILATIADRAAANPRRIAARASIRDRVDSRDMFGRKASMFETLCG